MHICIEGPDSLDDKTLEDIVNYYIAVKHRKNFTVNFMHTFNPNSVFILRLYKLYNATEDYTAFEILKDWL